MKRKSFWVIALLVVLLVGTARAEKCPDPVLVKTGPKSSAQAKAVIGTLRNLCLSTFSPVQLCNALKEGIYPKAKDATFSAKDAATFYHLLAKAYIKARYLGGIILALNLGLADHETDESYQLLIRTYDTMNMRKEEARTICKYARFLENHKRTAQALLLLKAARKNFSDPDIDLLIGAILSHMGDKKARSIFEQDAVKKAKESAQEHSGEETTDEGS